VSLVTTLEGNGSKYALGTAALVLIVLFLIFVRMYLVRRQNVSETGTGSKESSEVGFVVHTFHDVVAKLKEKEKELEKLKAFAEEKAGRMEAYNENILQSVPSGVISIDNSISIKSANQAAGRILGTDAGTMIGKKFDDVFREPLTMLLNEDKIVSRAEYQYVTDDKRHIWLGITTSQLRNSSGEKIGLIFVFTDLTDIKGLQAQVELKQRLSQLGEMSAGISHELRNSMSVISGYAKLLSKKVEAANRGTVESIQSEISHMDRIISELLAFAKPSVLNVEPVIINDLIKETIDTVITDNNSIKVTFTAARPVTVNADTVLLRQALSNVIANAVDAMTSGGCLDIHVVSTFGKAEVNIKDTGHGFPEELKDKIFLPFFTTKEEGIGFGLALVQKIVVSHGGIIEVQSREGEGTSFVITLPALEQEA
jgi:PAS domain S-box-containing protein